MTLKIAGRSSRYRCVSRTLDHVRRVFSLVLGATHRFRFLFSFNFRAVDDFNGFCALGGYFNREMRSTLSKDPWRKVLFKQV